MAPAAQLQNSEAFAAVAQLFQSTQGQQVGVCAVQTDRSFDCDIFSLITLLFSSNRCSRPFSSSR